MEKQPVRWANNTNCDVSMFDAMIADACRNGGTLPEELADVFALVRTPPGSAVEWRLELQPDVAGGR